MREKLIADTGQARIPARHDNTMLSCICFLFGRRSAGKEGVGMREDTDKAVRALNALSAAFMAMNKELTAMLAACRGEYRETACALCGEEVSSGEIKENNGYCEYCATANDRADIWRTSKHPDER